MSNLKNFHGEKKIGELLIEQKMIQPADLEQALNKQIEMAQKGFELRIGEILVASGKVQDRNTLISLLVRRGVKLRIGEILVLLNKITEEQYKDIQRKIILNKKNGVSKSFGDMAIDLGYIDAISFYNLLEDSGIPLDDGEKLVQKGIISRENLLFFREELKRDVKFQGKTILNILLSNGIITQEVYEQYNKKSWNEGAIDFV